MLSDGKITHTPEEIKKEIERRCKRLDHIVVADSLKQEVIGTALVMETCLAAAEIMIKESNDNENYTDQQFIEISNARGIAMFDAITKRALMAQTQQQQATIQLPDNIRRL